MIKNVYTVTFTGYPVPSGRVAEATRRTENVYTHACYRDGKITFHKDISAAYRRAGKRGAVKRLDNREDVA